MLAPRTTGSSSRDGRFRECAIETVAFDFGEVSEKAQIG